MKKRTARHLATLGLLGLVVGLVLLGTYFGGSIIMWTHDFITWLQDVAVGNSTSAEWLNVTARITAGAQDKLLASWAGQGEYWLVDGTYYAGQSLSMWLEVTITFSNVENVTVEDAYILCSDADNPANYELYDLADNEPVSGDSPVTWVSIKIARDFETFIRADIGSTADTVTVEWHFYVKVTGVGSTSGQTYVAEIPETFVESHVFSKGEESLGTSNAELKVQFSSWVLFTGVGATLTGLVLLGVAGHTLSKRKR